MRLNCSIFILSGLFFGGMFYSCGNDYAEESPIENEEISPAENEEEVESGVFKPFIPLILSSDSVAPPEVILAGEPIFNKAHQNIKPVEQPILKVLGSSPPHFSIGRDSIKEPVRQIVNGVIKSSGYNEPVTGSKFDFNDAASYNIQGIDVDQGLSSSYVMDMIEDSRGNLWFATWTAGVTMYNGRSFIMFDENKGMQSNYVWCIFEDHDGNIWFGSDGSGASVYDGHKFIDFNVGSPLESRIVFDITGDKDGNIWFATNAGLTKFDGRVFETYTTEQGLGSNIVNSIFVAENGDVWVGLDGAGVNKFDGEGFTHFTVNEGLISDNVTAVYEDSEENLWIGTLDSGICMYDGYSFITWQKEMGLPNNFIKSILEDSRGNMWFGTEGGGACMFNRFEFKHFSSREGMSNNFIWSLLEDSDGNIWFGTFGAGANVYNERTFENYTEHQGLSDHIIRYIIQDRQDNMWFSSNHGVSKYDGKHFWHYTEEQGLPMNLVRNMLIDSNGDFWFGTGGNGVSRFDGEYFYNYNTESGLSGNFILCLFEDSRGNIWIGTANGGATRYDGNTFSHFTEEQGLANNTVHDIVEDSLGNIYLGTKIAGIDVYDGQNLKHITTREGLIENSVISLLTATDGSIWVGSEGYGLSHLLADTILTYELEGGNSHNIIWSMVEDHSGALWLGTERGLNHFSVTDSLGVIVTNYGKLDGLKGSDFYPGSAYMDGQNRIWWGTGKALAMLDLNKYEENQKAPSIQVTDVRLEQTFIDYRRVKSAREKDKSYYLDEEKTKDLDDISFDQVVPFTNCPEQLELPYYLNHLTFYFSGIDWSAPHKVRYQYMLQGLDEGWRPITEENWAVYSNTPSGEYIFKVRAIGDAKIWSDIFAYPVIIHPPWWTTWWAYILYLIIASISLYLFIRFRTAKLLQNKRQLEETVSQRTAEVVQQKELVERKNQEITASITYAKRIQNAILPSKTQIDNYLPNSFFIYMPKDIVAGDFYWLETSHEDVVLLAAADCTGHGVPGAMVSVVCNNALNRAVREFNLKSPADILNKVRELVIKTFEASITEVNDGMDISLVAINPKTRELTYAGANNDLYIVSGGELQILSSDKMPVGRYLKKKDFEEQTVQLKEGDCVYLFTDGYADQFGGPHYKKFKYSSFKQLILDLNKLPLDKQADQLVNVIKDWMGTYEQIDDICIIGVKV